ncbi:dynein light chain Tctex-type protein 2B-like [Gigantopelta aegis]|uniref:dynein light chain Tctex-type protein 2B-like n=1 Tax=Gigantopelta aegis TaxID=1735272 RepID=UPI001B88CF83|nr:dynein light chain Tctex-type protein 2B-like [Gigantopelta aegis]
MDVVSSQTKANFSVPGEETPSTSDKSRRVSVFTFPSSKDGTDDSEPVGKASAMFGRRSTFRGFAKTIQKVLALEKLTKLGTVMRPTINYENTYRLTPVDRFHYNPEKVERAIMLLLEAQLANVKYEPKRCTAQTRRITDLVKTKVKQMDFQRYKLVCSVMLGQCNDQGIEAVSRCVWDSQADGCACIHYKNDSLFAVVTVYGVYFE